MNQFRLYWEFHKSTLSINWAFSVVLSVLSSVWLLPVLSMTAGPLISFLYKEIARSNEYYYYHNRGISQVGLIAASLGLHVFTGVFLLIIMKACLIF